MTTHHRSGPVTLADALDERAFRNLHPLPFATVAPLEPTPPACERAWPCGVPLLDDLLGGVMPGSVTVVRSSWNEVARAVTAEIVVGVAQQGRRVLALSAPDTRALVDVLGARAGRITLDQVRSLDFTQNAEAYVRARGGVEPLHIDIARGPVDPDELDDRPDLVVVHDADAGGSLPGRVALPRWRELARALGAPVFVVVSGAAPGWTAMEDAHVELVRTHAGARAVWLLARGVAPGGAVERTLRLTLTRSTARLRILPRDWPTSTVPPPRSAERNWWVEEASSLLDEVALVRVLDDQAWTPASAREAYEVLTSLAMLALEGTPLRPRMSWHANADALERTIATCGGLERWMDVLAATGEHHDRFAWSQVERSGVPLAELPETAPAAWRAARRLRRHVTRGRPADER